MYSEHNPHPDIKYVGTRGKTVWYQCQKCSRYMHSLKYFGWACPHCNDEDIDMIIGVLDY
jgi:Zn finger protein HypA/HybF involved in hydrogenase expression